ncbi:hypothetical protein IKQ26_05490 [bacterium]|nr:hypothetical protein [bacterium]
MFKKFINKFLLKPKIKIRGEGNSVSVPKSAYTRKFRVKIFGNNNKVIISDNAHLHNTKIDIGFPECPINNCTVSIGQKTTANGLYICLGESASEVIVGDNCMISFEVEMSCTDTHSITDLQGNLLNKGHFIHIGSRVWVCKRTTFLKDIAVKDDCVVAQNSVVTSCFDKTNCVIAGYPARIVKEGILWSSKRPENWEEQ